MTVDRVDDSTLRAWHAMRALLWPDETLEALDQVTAKLRNSNLLFLVARHDGDVAGFAEASIRHDYVNGCETSPVVFLEGMYVRPEYRLLGVARAMSEAVGRWGRERGCSEFASDALLENEDSHAMHRALGFEETERVVYFRKLL